MYGKKRIVITNNNKIVLKGGGSHIPIGIINKEPNLVTGRLLRPENYMESRFTETNSMTFRFSTINELRKITTVVYREHIVEE